MGRPRKYFPEQSGEADPSAEVVELQEGFVNVTWLGEDELHADGHGPDVNTWRGIDFPKGEPVAISDPAMIEKAKVNRFYKVED